MAYFKLSLLTKFRDKDGMNNYIKNTISEFYGNNVSEDILKYEKNNDQEILSTNSLTNVYTNTYTYNEKLNLHQQGQKDLTFSLDKMILDNDNWTENPFSDRIKIGSQLLLEDKHGNLMLFTVKDITYNLLENNVIYSFSCQDSFSYQLTKQNDGYTINNDISSNNFIGAMSIDSWAEKIVKECKITYKYLKLNIPLYLYTDGSASTTLLRDKTLFKVIKQPYIKNADNNDLYETIPFSCSSTTANGALISLGESIGLSLNTATVTTTSDSTENFVELITYFWFEPSKKDVISGLKYSPFRNIKNFSLSQQSDSMITVLNINSRTLSSDVEITPLPSVSPFFSKCFNSTYWKKNSVYSKGLYTKLLKGSSVFLNSDLQQYTFSNEEDYRQDDIISIYHDGSNLYINKRISKEDFLLYSLYDSCVVNSGSANSTIFFTINYNIKTATTNNSKILCKIHKQSDAHYIVFTITNNDLSSWINEQEDENFSFHLYGFFKTGYTDEDIEFAKAADQLPWLENKLIDFNYFINNGMLSKSDEKDITNRIYNDLRKINSDILLNANIYYSRIHKQTEYLSTMTNNIDSVGAEVANIVDKYKKDGKIQNYDTNNLIQRWSLLQYSVTGAAPSNETSLQGTIYTSGFVNLHETASGYMRTYLSSRQRCLKNLYNFRNYFNAPLDDMYQRYYDVTIIISDNNTENLDNLYRFSPQNEDRYRILTEDDIQKYPAFFVKDEDNNVVDYHNITLYNNDLQHSVFDKENYLINKNNYYNFNLHCYQDVLHTTTENDFYNKEITYLQQVFFLRLEDVFDIINGNFSEYPDIKEEDIKINIQIEDNNYIMPCEVKMYETNRKYLVCNKLYEDEVSFDYSKIVIKAGSTIKAASLDRDYHFDINDLKRPLYLGEEFSSDFENIFEKDTLNFVTKKDDNYICSGELFYQPITSTSLFKGFLWRNWKNGTLNLKERKDFKYEPFNNLLNGNNIGSRTILDIDHPFDYSKRPDDKIGWGKIEYEEFDYNWPRAVTLTLLTASLLGGLSGISKNTVTSKFLIRGSYNGTARNMKGHNIDYSLYASRDSKLDSIYIQNYPLEYVYYEQHNDDGTYTYTERQLVNAYNYQNFYVKDHKNQYISAENGLYTSINQKNNDSNNERFRVAEGEKEKYSDFISDFPQYFFYAKNPIEDDSNVVQKIIKEESIEFRFNDNLAWSFGNFLFYRSLCPEDPQYDVLNLRYKKTKIYQKETFAGIWGNFDYQVFKAKTNAHYNENYLVIDATRTQWNTPDNMPAELNQYINYDIIEEGQVMTGKQLYNFILSSDTGYSFYFIKNYIEEEIPSDVSARDFFSMDIIVDEELATLEDYYNHEDIVNHLYYVEKNVPVSPDSLLYNGEKYILYDHLLDNKFELYNEANERIYTINQIFDNLTYKYYQTYQYSTFDYTTPITLNLYRYNASSSIPDTILYNFDFSDIRVNTHVGLHGYSPYEDFKYTVYVTVKPSVFSVYSNPTNGDFWYEYTTTENTIERSKMPLLEYAALIESNLQTYWNEAYAASLQCDIFIPEEWRVKQERVENKFGVVATHLDDSGKVDSVGLNELYVPVINKITDNQYTLYWDDTPPIIENSQLYSYNQLSLEQQKEVDNLLTHTQNVSTNLLYFSKIKDNISFYTIKKGGCNWATFINSAVGVQLNHYAGWSGIAVNYLTSHFVDYGISLYEQLIENRNNLWKQFFEQYPFLFLEASYTNSSATTSEELLTMAKYAFEDQKYPEKSYSISLIDLVHDVESIDIKTKSNKTTYNHQYYNNLELHIGDGIQVDIADYIENGDDLFNLLSTLLFITDISIDLRNDGNCNLTVNTIKYQDKLIRRLAKLIRNNPLN